MSADSRQYYTMIRECGGFKRFNLNEKKPEFKIVNIDEVAEDLLNGNKDNKKDTTNEDSTKMINENENIENEPESNVEEPIDLGKVINSNNEKDEDLNVFEPDNTSFGSGIPDLM